jgi:hypothetical protein
MLVGTRIGRSSGRVRGSGEIGRHTISRGVAPKGMGGQAPPFAPGVGLVRQLGQTKSWALRDVYDGSSSFALGAPTQTDERFPTLFILQNGAVFELAVLLLAQPALAIELAPVHHVGVNSVLPRHGRHRCTS